MNTLLNRISQFVCGLHGHDALLHFGEGRVSMQCASCGYETPGWDLRGTRVVEEEAGPDHMMRAAILVFAVLCAAPAFAQNVTISGRGPAVVVTGPVVRLSPVEALTILLGPAMQSNRTGVLAPPAATSKNVTVNSTPAAAYWTKMPPSAEHRRLDGTLLTQPAQVYGPTSVVIVQDEQRR